MKKKKYENGTLFLSSCLLTASIDREVTLGRHASRTRPWLKCTLWQTQGDTTQHLTPASATFPLYFFSHHTFDKLGHIVSARDITTCWQTLSVQQHHTGGHHPTISLCSRGNSSNSNESQRVIYLCWQEHTWTQYLQDLYSAVKLDWNQTTKLLTAQLQV